MTELRLQYHTEQSSRLKLQDEYEKLKAQYDRATEEIEEEKNLDSGEAKRRLQKLEKQLVGGEQVSLLFS